MPTMARIDSFNSPRRTISTRMESLFLDSSPDFGPVKYETAKVRAIGEMTAPVLPNTNFRERSRRLRAFEDDKNLLIDDLIKEIETNQHKLDQALLDLEMEKENVRECQKREDELVQHQSSIRSLLESNSYVTILIDGDSFTFTRDVWSMAYEGGLRAAGELYETIKQFVRKNSNFPGFQPHERNVRFKIFIHLQNLRHFFATSKYAMNDTTINDFIAGLLCDTYHFDVVDTSFNKELTRKKFEDSFAQDVLNVHCHHIFLATRSCNGFSDEWSMYETLPGVDLHSRITFLNATEPSSTHTYTRARDFTRCNLPDCMTMLPANLTKETPATKVATPVLRRVSSNTSSGTMSSAQPSSTSTPVITWAAMTALPFVPKAGEHSRTSSMSTAARPDLLHRSKSAANLVPRNRHGQRVDSVDDSIPYQELQRIKKMKLCNQYYLSGKSACDGGCNHSHTYPLQSHEKSILKEVARMTPCHYKLDCPDPSCIYGHRCPQSKPDKKDCFYKDACRFTGWGHGIDTKVIKGIHIK